MELTIFKATGYNLRSVAENNPDRRVCNVVSHDRLSQAHQSSNVYIKGLTDLNQNELSWVLTLAKDGLLFITARERPQGSPRCATITRKGI